jgi:hypothetical protein
MRPADMARAIFNGIRRFVLRTVAVKTQQRDDGTPHGSGQGSTSAASVKKIRRLAVPKGVKVSKTRAEFLRRYPPPE